MSIIWATTKAIWIKKACKVLLLRGRLKREMFQTAFLFLYGLVFYKMEPL